MPTNVFRLLDICWELRPVQIDHMDGWRDFTFHPEHYPLPEMQVLIASTFQGGGGEQFTRGAGAALPQPYSHCSHDTAPLCHLEPTRGA